jgi:ribosomal protein S27AE
MANTKFSKENRNSILTDLLHLRTIIDKLVYDIEAAPNDRSLREHLLQEYNKVLDELQALENQYVSYLPKIKLSRCPFTNSIFKYSIDVMGIDGPWWDAERPIRAIENEIESFFALTGSIHITGEIPEIPFPVKPGPAVPWVSPRLLENSNIKSVISHIKIGVYDAYVTVYYSKDKSVEIERINTWGTDEYLAEDKDGFAISGSTYDDVEEYDFDLAPWIKKGKLFWIHPKDENFKIQNSTENCPFLNLEGYRFPVLIQNQKSTNCMIKLEYDDIEKEDESIKISRSNFCSNCGEPVIKGAKFCANCGNKLN